MTHIYTQSCVNERAHTHSVCVLVFTQVNRFLETYSALAKDIPAPTLSLLQNQFSNLSAHYQASASGDGPSPLQLAAALQDYLTAVRATCRATWARFNPAKMVAGVAVLALAVLLCLVVSQRDDGGVGLALAPAAASGGCALVAAAAAMTRLTSEGHVDTSWCLGAAALTSTLTLLWGACRSRRTWRTLLAAAETAPLLVLLLRCASLLSDSYVVFEGRAVTFLLFSLALYVPVSLHWEGLLLPATGTADPLKGSGLLQTPSAAPSSVIRRQSGTLLAATALLVAALYTSLAFHGCREEQGAACSPSYFLSPLARLQDSRRRNLHYLLSVGSLGLWTYLLRRCLRHYGNLNTAGGAALVARWLLPLLAVALALHWAVGATPEGSFRGLAELMGVARQALPRIAYLLLGAGLLLVWLRPLTVYVKSRAGPGPEVAPPPIPPRYRASTGISPQAELHHLIPQIYQRMRRSLDDSELSGSPAGGGGGPAVEAYGLGTVYSTPLLLLCGLLAAGLLVLHADAMAPAFLLLLLEGGALLHVHASYTSLKALQGAPAGKTLPTTTTTDPPEI